MPKPAQDRITRGPLAALLLLFSLFLTSASAATAGDLRAPARLAPSRQGAAAALVPSGTRNSSDDEPLGAGAGPYVLPPAPGIVTLRLWAGPANAARSAPSAAIPRPTAAAYRARAPPAF